MKQIRTPGPDIVDPIGEAYRRLEHRRKVHRALSQLASIGEALKDLADAASFDAHNDHDEARSDLIRRLLEVTGAEIPDIEEWYTSDAPLVTHRSGGRLYVISPAGEASCPHDGADPATSLQVAIIEDDPGKAVAS